MSRVECDKARCSGCLACIVACLDQHYDEADGYAVPAAHSRIKLSIFSSMINPPRKIPYSIYYNRQSNLSTLDFIFDNSL